MDWSPRRLLQALVRPARAFASDARPPASVGVAVLAVVALVNTAVVLQGAGAVAAATTGTVAVDNPDRPADWVCEDATSDDDSIFDSQREACETEPETVQRSLSSYAQSAASSVAGQAFVAPLAAALALSGAVAMLYGGRGSDDPDSRVSLLAVLGVTGVGFAPALARYAARWWLVERDAASGLTSGTIEAAESTAVAALTPESTLYVGVAVVTAVWSAYVWRAGWRAVLPDPDLRADAAAVAGGLLVVVAATSPYRPPAEMVPLGFVLVAFGAAPLAAPRLVERVDLFFDLIGTRGGEDIEFEPWRIHLEQSVGFLLVAGGALAVGALYLI